MTQNQTLSFDCLALHDTQMVDLQKEQSMLRKIYAGNAQEPSTIPFFPLPPICPITERKQIAEKPTIGLLIAQSGWILRPLPDFTERSPMQKILGYPDFPQTIGFIFGYAGERAHEIVTELNERIPAKAFQVNVWRYDAVTVSITYDPGREYSCTYEISLSKWQKAQ
jgi:hypothetical protein